jgi:hypothetical protein
MASSCVPPGLGAQHADAWRALSMAWLLLACGGCNLLIDNEARRFQPNVSSTPDASAPPVDGDVPAVDGGVSACTVGAAGSCRGATPLTCIEDRWVAQQPCAGNTPTCMNGVCTSRRVTGGFSSVADAPGAAGIRLRDHGFEVAPISCGQRLCVQGSLGP